MARPTRGTTPVDRFWAGVRPEGRLATDDRCWEWVLPLPPGNRYPMLRVGGKSIKAHRFSYELHNGPIPAGVKVRHRCDNTICVRPHHLLLGSQKDNVADSISRGRFHRARGERNGKATLSDAQVEEIRERHQFRKVTYAMLAAEFGVGYTTVQSICRGVGRFAGGSASFGTKAGVGSPAVISVASTERRASVPQGPK